MFLEVLNKPLNGNRFNPQMKRPNMGLYRLGSNKSGAVDKEVEKDIFSNKRSTKIS